MGKAQSVGEWISERRSAFVAGVGALVVTMLCVGGAVALMIEDRPRYEAGADSRQPLIPTIVTADVAVVHDLSESRARSAETIEAGEVVYAAAERTFPSTASMLRRLRVALDEATRTLEDELPADAGPEERERHIEELEARRASVLDAASMLTQVRRVPAEELPEGTMTITDPVIAPGQDPQDGTPSQEPGGEPTTEPTPGPSPDPSPEPSEDATGEVTDLPVPTPTDEPSPDPSEEPSDGATDGGLAPQPPDDDGGLDGLFGDKALPDDPSPSPSGSSSD